MLFLYLLSKIKVIFPGSFIFLNDFQEIFNFLKAKRYFILFNIFDAFKNAIEQPHVFDHTLKIRIQKT